MDYKLLKENSYLDILKKNVQIRKDAHLKLLSEAEDIEDIYEMYSEDEYDDDSPYPENDPINPEAKEELEEGFLRGLASEFTEIADYAGELIDLFHRGPEKVVPRVKKIISRLKRTLSRIKSLKPIDKRGQNPLLKHRQTSYEWRFYYFLKDDVFKRVLNHAIKTGKDPIGWFDFNIHERIVPALYKAKTPRDLIKLADLYEKRVEMVYSLYKKNPENKGLKALLKQGITGLRDFTIAVKRFAAYMAE